MQPLELFEILFHQLGIKHNNNKLNEILRSTPYLNSMYGIGIALSKYKIDNKCVRLVHKDAVRDIPMGIIIFNGQFVVLQCSDKDGCILHLNKNKTQHISTQELYAGWNGVVTIIQPKESSITSEYSSNKEKSKTNYIVICGIILLAAFITISVLNHHHFYSWALLLVMVVNVLGIGVSFLLLQKQLHIPNKIADKLCGIAKDSHCDEVTQSKGATFLGFFKLSEIGSSFFVVNIITLIFVPLFANALSVIAIIVLPFSFWSIWYQKVKAKSWCVLCLLTLALMWIQAGLYIAGGYYVWNNSTIVLTITLLGIAYIIMGIFLNRIMWLIERDRKNSIWEGEFNYLKSQNYVVDAYLAQTKPFNVSTENCSSLFFGEEDALHVITVYSNPYCLPCALMHKRIEGFPGINVKIQYVMTYFTDEYSIINKFIIAAYQQLGAEKTWKILTEWYATGKTQGVVFFAKYNLDIATDSVAKEFEKQNAWSNDNKLYGTPTVLVNGYEIEYPYEVSDYMLFPY
ncbi:MAG: thioredoxin domain-containing protein [Bacteroides sp.]|nr:thioredoxin domain-containing protein [Bacteroides sp.]